MRLLLDTSVLIWWLTDNPRLKRDVDSTIRDPGNEAFASVASVWEIAIKRGLGKLETAPDVGSWLPEALEATGIVPLPIGLRHAAAVEHLAHHHRDPFDRLIIAQAIEEGLAVVTADAVFRAYPIQVVPT